MDLGSVGLVLPGGGSRGPYQVGCLHALDVMDGFPQGVRFVSSTSVGTLNALALAMFSPGPQQVAQAVALMVEGWCSLDGTEDVWELRFPWYLAGLWHLSIGKTGALRRFLHGWIDVPQVQASGVELRMTAVDLLSGQLRVFTQDEIGDDFEAPMASAAFPVAFPPESFAGGLWLDGGIRDIAPVGAAIAAGCDPVLVFPLRPIGCPGRVEFAELRNVVDVAMRSLDLAEQEIVENDIQLARMVNRLVAAGAGDPDHREVVIDVYAPAEPLGSPLEFEPKRIRAEMLQGYEDTLAALGYGEAIPTWELPPCP